MSDPLTPTSSRRPVGAVLLALAVAFVFAAGPFPIPLHAADAPGTPAVAGNTVTGPGTSSVEETFKRALFAEEGRRDYKAALEGYEAVVRALDDQRRLAATAVFRLGECYRKLGRTNDAVAQYERVLRDFSEEDVLGQLSRQNLGALGRAVVGTPEAGGDPAQAFALNQEVILLESQLEMLRKLPADQIAATFPTLFPSAGIGVLRIRGEIDAGMLRLGDLRSRFGDQHPDVRSTRELLTTLDQRLHQEIQDVVSAQQTRLEALRSATSKLAGRSPAEDKQNAAEAEEIRAIRVLVANSPDRINVTGGKNPLHQAAENGQLAVARFLLENGARIDVPGSSGQTALHFAARVANKAMVEFLLEHGADPNLRDATGATPLHIAASQGYLGLAEVLLAKRANPNVLSNDGSPLYGAVAKGRIEIARLLLSNGANPNARVDGKAPPLRFAHSLDLVRLLLEHKADPNLDGGARLVWATNQKQMDVLEALLGAGANPDLDAQLSEGTALFVAVSKQLRAEAELLVKHGAAINRITSASGQAAIHVAAASLSPDWLAWVLDHGGHPNLRDLGGRTPLLLVGLSSAHRVPAPPSAGLRLPAIEALPGQPLGGVGVANANVVLNTVHDVAGSRAAPEDRWAKVQILLKRGARADAPFADGTTFVHHLAVWAGPEEFAVVRATPAKLDPAGPAGFTPLMVAASNDNVSGLGLLLEAGVDVNTADEAGNTALHHAAYNQKPLVVKRLLDSGADPGRTNRFGDTPARLAREGARYAVSGYTRTILGVSELSRQHPQGVTAGRPRQVEEVLALLPAPPGAAAVGPRQNLIPQINLPQAARPGRTVVFFGAVSFTVELPLGVGRTLTLSEALLGRPELNTANANLRTVKVHRAPSGTNTVGETLTIDVQSGLKNNDRSKDLELRPGDRVEVPEKWVN